MRYAPLCAALAASVGALAPAAADGFIETAARSSPRDAIATCLRSTGDPGQLALLGPLSRRGSPTDLVEAGGGRLSERGRASVGALFECAAVATGGSTLVVAGARWRGDGEPRLKVLVRDRAAKDSRTTTLGRIRPGSDGQVAAAVSPRGDVLVAWVDGDAATLESSGRARIMVARRPPGGSFGAPEQLAPLRPLGEGELLLTAGLDAAGAATVAWARPVPGGRRISGLSVVEVRSAPPAARFGATQRLAGRAQDTSDLRLETAPDGRALLAYSANEAVTAFERAPGRVRFTELARFGGSLRSGAAEPAIALRPDGAAVIAWRFDTFDGSTPGVRAAMRAGPGGLGPALTIDRTRGPSPGGGSFLGLGDPPFAPIDQDNLALSAALAGDGRVVLAWTVPRGLPFGDRPLGPRGVAGRLDRGFGAAMSLGCPCRDTNGIAALLDATGAPAVAWTDNLSNFGLGAEAPLAAGGGRLHLAYPGRAAPAVTPPRVRLEALGPHRLRFGQPVRIAARCSGACDLRALVPGSQKGPPRALGTASIAGRGRTVIEVSPSISSSVAPRRPGRVAVIVRAYAPNTTSFTAARVKTRLSRLPVPPTPLPLDVKARREGRTVSVSWRTARPARQVTFFVDGRRRRPEVAQKLNLIASVPGRGRTRFRARLRLEPADHVRFVGVTASGNVLPSRQRTVVVPVGR